MTDQPKVSAYANAMYHLGRARDGYICAHYAESAASAEHFTGYAVDSLREAARHLGFDLVPRPADPVQPAATAEALYGVPV